MKSFVQNTILILLLLALEIHGFAQNEKDQIVVAYLNNFAKYITWPNEASIDTFRIIIYSSDENLVKEFNEFSEKRKIKDKPVKIYTGKSEIDLNKSQIILLTDTHSEKFNEVHNAIESNHVLLVTEGFKEKRQVMINLYETTENKILFEVNKSNIINQNLLIDPEILLAGGTEIDVASLYRSSQVELRNMSERLGKMEDSLDMLNQNILKSLKQINIQENKLDSQKRILKHRTHEIDSLYNTFETIELLLKKQKDSIRIKNSIADLQLKKLIQQREELEEQEQILSLTQKKIDTLNAEIEFKNTILGDQTKIIQRQKLILNLSIVVAAIIISLIVMVFISYRNNKQKNILLVKQKEEIETNLNELKRLNVRLKHADHYKSIFLASMSHELRTPLNSIIGYTGIVLMGMTGELNNEQHKQLKKVKNNANHLLSLINDILDISKIEANKIELEIEEFKLMDVVKEVVEIISLKAEEKQIAVKNDINKNLILTTDKRRLKQVILNLASNSVKYSNSGTVRIYTDYLPENKFRLTVEDNGIGISEIDKAKLFQPFQQIDSTLARKTSGTGLGLYLSRKIISLLGGYISVNSELGKGSQFYFEMPIVNKQLNYETNINN